MFRYECGLMDILVASGLNIYPFLVVRILARYKVWPLASTHPSWWSIFSPGIRCDLRRRHLAVLGICDRIIVRKLL
jgi:hypothetical protein